MKRRTFLHLPLIGAASAAAGPDALPTRLGILADPQYADKDPANQRHYRASLGKLDRAIERLNAADLDAVVTLGDFIDQDFASFAPVMRRYEALRAPHLKVPGNHDFSVEESRKDQVLAALGMEQPYAARTLGNWRLILLDGTEVSLFRPQHADSAQHWLKRLEAQGRSNARPWNSAMGEDQLTWLERELEAATTAGRRVLLACHYPLLPDDPHNLWNDREVIALIDRFPCVAAWFNGHHHAGNYARRKHCHYVNFKGMVETADHGPFAIARLYSDRIEIEGFDTELDRRLEASP